MAPPSSRTPPRGRAPTPLLASPPPTLRPLDTTGGGVGGKSDGESGMATGPLQGGNEAAHARRDLDVEIGETGDDVVYADVSPTVESSGRAQAQPQMQVSECDGGERYEGKEWRGEAGEEPAEAGGGPEGGGGEGDDEAPDWAEEDERALREHEALLEVCTDWRAVAYHRLAGVEGPAISVLVGSFIVSLGTFRGTACAETRSSRCRRVTATAWPTGHPIIVASTPPRPHAELCPAAAHPRRHL